MKKILLLLLSILILGGCNDEQIELVDYLNQNNVSIYLFNEYVENDYGINNFSNLKSLDSIDLSNNYTCIIINVLKNHELLNKKIVESLYDLLLKDDKVMIIFYEGDNYNFFKNTRFANEKDYYDDTSQIYSYNNFNRKIKESLANSNIKSYLSCLMHLEGKIKEFRGSLWSN